MAVPVKMATCLGREFCLMCPNSTSTHWMLKSTNTRITFKISSCFSSNLGWLFLSQYELCSSQFQSLQLQLLGSYVRAEVIKGPQEWKMHFSPLLHKSPNGMGNAMETPTAHSSWPLTATSTSKKKKKKFTLEGKKKGMKNVAGLKFSMPKDFSKESCK